MYSTSQKTNTYPTGQQDLLLITKNMCASQTISNDENSFSNLLFERILFGSSARRALLYSSTGNRFLSLACRAASSSLSLGTWILHTTTKWSKLYAPIFVGLNQEKILKLGTSILAQCSKAENLSHSSVWVRCL